MGAAVIVNDLEFATVLSGSNLSTSEGWKVELALHHEDIGRSVGMTSTGNGTRLARMIAQSFTHYATAACIRLPS